MSEELKLCPFCGGAAIVSQNTAFDGLFYVYCSECFAASDDGKKQEAITAWNCRAEPDTENAPLTLDELRGMDGEPVWCVWVDGQNGEWRIAHVDSELGLSCEDWKDALWDSQYGKTWLAYRHKPEGV